MVPHIVRRCPNVPSRIRERLAPLLGKRVRDAPYATASPKRTRMEGLESPSNVHKPVSKSERNEFHQAIASPFYSTGLAFRVIENPAMRYILTRYRSRMPLPTRQELATVLLDKAYTTEWENVNLVLEGQPFVAVVCDGWSVPNNESIVDFIVVSPFIRPIFWSSICTVHDRHTGKYIATALTKVVHEVEAVVGKGSVCGAVTDNASNMCKFRELVIEAVPGIACHGCAAHTLNLVLKDMFAIPYLREVLKKAVAISKFVRLRPALLYRFRDVQRLRLGLRQRRRTLVTPVSTRWYSSTNCISSIVRNEEVIREIFC
ncbi:hypothetical protein P3T76_013363 [Phytophthora citrophthora]|uniref:DUF659 domain-containing protein n=1 Tax=Phytophthora citrophthora TaxID=4793 RepID=A0AAD9G376_9STRA|nr:hypothetical protein P3T76_013363 [Phytophthora citrophthora]